MYANILVPIALDHEHEPGDALSIAKSLAADGAKIIALHVVEEVPAYVAQYLPEEQMAQNVKELEARLSEAVAGVGGVTAKVVSGHAGHTIVDEAREMGVDLIVIASHRPGLQDYFLGSTAARVVRHAPCSVHVMR